MTNAKPLGHKVGAAKSQFIAEIRKAVRSADHGRSEIVVMQDIRRALHVLDRSLQPKPPVS